MPPHASSAPNDHIRSKVAAASSTSDVSLPFHRATRSHMSTYHR